MSNFIEHIKDYFHTDWSAMTLHDWLGLAITIVVFLVMIALYVYIFHPANREKLEKQRYIPLDEDAFTLYKSEREDPK